ncbi:MAG: (d)CMP kinase [Candidatus Omnitrophota bacterium]
MFNKITIIGVGLIGGSIGLSVKEKKLAGRIIGVCRHQQSLEQAVEKGLIDQGTLDCRAAIKDADLVILSAPVLQIIDIAKKIAPHLKEGCLLTDAGSTKAAITREIESVLPPGVYFVGAHPLAGSEKRGAAFARRGLFDNSLCILTRTPKTNRLALERIKKFWQELGCRTRVLSVQEHDRHLALSSHLPHLVAAQLVKTAKNSLAFAAGGFADTTRIAASDPQMWADIFFTNRKFIVQSVDKYIKNLKLVRKSIQLGERKKLSAELKKIKRLRDSLFSPDCSGAVSLPRSGQAAWTGKNVIIAIDGPAGAGKSTVAKKLAKRLGMLYVDTGAMYRALTLKAVKENVLLSDEQALAKLARSADIRLCMKGDALKIILDGEDVSKDIRQPSLTEKVRYVAKVRAVREEMVKMQRRLAESQPAAVLEGRDIGTVVFPDARYKFYLDAQAEQRVERRFQELKRMGQDVTVEDIRADIIQRDTSDMTRTVAPLVKAEDALYIDTTELGIQEVVDKILKKIKEKGADGCSTA